MQITELIETLVRVSLEDGSNTNRTLRSKIHDPNAAGLVIRGQGAGGSHQCRLCGRRFRKATDLTRHMQGPHREAGSPMFRCRDGHYRTPRKDNYVRHLMACKRKAMSDRPFYCRCGRAGVVERPIFVIFVPAGNGRLAPRAYRVAPRGA
jgi:hypothetical protein